MLVQPRNYKSITALVVLLLISATSFARLIDEKETVKIKSTIDSLNILSYNNRRSDPKLSLELALNAFELAKGIDYKKGNAHSLHNIGTAKAVLGQFDKALIDLIESSRVREEICDNEGLTSTYNNIGFVYAQLNDDNKALVFYEKALECRKLTNEKRDLGVVINNIGNVHFRKKNYDKALQFFTEALKVNREVNDERGVSGSLSNIGLVYHTMGDLNKGLEYHLQAYELGKKHNDKFGLISTLRNIAEVYTLKKQYVEATNYGLRSLILSQELGSLAEEKSTAGVLANIYQLRERFKEAAHYLRLESNLKDSLFSIQSAENLARMQTAYELDSKIRENEFLKKEQSLNENRINLQRLHLVFAIIILCIVLFLLFISYSANKRIKHFNREFEIKNNEIFEQKEIIQEKVSELEANNNNLQEINQIKNKLISVIAHDLKNPFNSISGYSELLLNQFRDYSQKEQLNFITIIHDNALKGNMLLDNLLQWSKLQTRTIQFLPVEHNLFNLVTDELYFQSHKAKEKDIIIRTGIPKDTVVFADSNMLKTIIRNLCSNALKFTRREGTITIAATKEANHVLISVSDSGEGIEPHIKDKLFTGEAGVTTANESGEKGTGLGLMLCKDFVNKHNGTIWVESEPNRGATFFFTLPHKV